MEKGLVAAEACHPLRPVRTKFKKQMWHGPVAEMDGIERAGWPCPRVKLPPEITHRGKGKKGGGKRQ